MKKEKLVHRLMWSFCAAHLLRKSTQCLPAREIQGDINIDFITACCLGKVKKSCEGWEEAGMGREIE
jgi:hypothetical protein